MSGALALRPPGTGDGVDELTGLCDRDGLLRRGRGALARARHARRSVALLVVDLDDFARLDLGGPGTGAAGADGDAVLVEVAVRLSGLLGRDDLVARLGGDEFAVLTAPLPSPLAAEALARRVLDTLGRPVRVGSTDVRLTASVGLALLDTDGGTVPDLLRAAGRALCAAKADGGDATARVPRPAPSPPGAHPSAAPTTLRGHVRLAGDLRRAVQDRALVLHYQPRLDARTGLVRGFEALVRWDHPEHGLLLPHHVLPLARRARLRGGLADAVAEQALTDLHRLRELAPGASLSLNVCARRRGGRGLVEGVVRRVAEAGHDPSDVVLDLTEPAPHLDAGLRGLLGRAHRAGLRVSVHGYGRASSCLRSLWASPAVHEVRVDRATVATLLCDPGAQRQVRGLVTAAHERGVTVVAEGVENEAVLATLRRLEVDVLQGLWLGPALDATDTARAARHWPEVRRAVLR